MVRGRTKLFPDYAPIFTGLHPTFVTIGGHRFSLESWRDLLLKTCEVARESKRVEFATLVNLRGTKNLWFSRKSKELRDPIKINGTKIFAETNANANELVLRSLQVLKFFKLEPRIDITTKR